jgi:hypothetical protein
MISPERSACAVRARAWSFASAPLSRESGCFLSDVFLSVATIASRI